MNFLSKIPDVMAVVGMFILVGTAGTSDVQPDYPFEKLVVQAVIGLALIVPMVVKGRWCEDEED